VTVQVLEPPEVTDVGSQTREDTAGIGTMSKEAVWVAAFSAAVSVTVTLVVSELAVAEKVVAVAPAGTVTVAGMINEALVSDSMRTLPPDGAGWFKVTVQMLLAGGVIVPGLQARAETATAAVRLKVALWEAPLRVAVTVAVWLVVIVPAVAVKVADVPLAGTVTHAGTVSAKPLPESATILPPAGAAWLSVTVQVVDAPEANVPGLQINEVRLNVPPTAIVPPVAVVGMAVAAADALSALVTLMAVPDVAGDSVAVTTATTPFWMTFAFSPVTRQV